MLSRRTALVSVAGAALAGNLTGQPKVAMYGLIGKMKALPGKRDELASAVLARSSAMPGCLSYVVAKDPEDADALWVTEVWDSEASHKASLSLPAVNEAIAKGRPLIASFGEYHTTEPIGFHSGK